MKPSDCVCAVVGSRKGKTGLADLGKEFFHVTEKLRLLI